MIYFDHNASTPVPSPFLEELALLFEQSAASPSSQHRAGRAARRLLSEATETLAQHLDCATDAVYWTSGASEANSWLIQGKKRLIVSAIEHESVLSAAHAAEREGSEVALLRVNRAGTVDLDHLDELLARDGQWDLISVMHSNNETGVLQPIESIVSRARAHGAEVHVDAVQSLGKLPLSLRRLGAQYLTLSGHKIGAPKGIGALVTNVKTPPSPLIHGAQQRGRRGGTENVVGAVLMARILRACAADRDAWSAVEKRHRALEDELKRKIPGTIVHGESSPRLPNTTFVGFEGVAGNGIVMNLDLENVCASSGSACASGATEPSHVLLAMGCDEKLASSSVRLSSGRETSEADFEHVARILPAIVAKARGARS